MAAEYVLGIDYGEKRVGVAVAHFVAQLPRPLKTLPNDGELFAAIQQIIQDEGIRQIVVGVPRNLDGSASEQTALCEQFAAAVARDVFAKVTTVDETLSSVEAEEYVLSGSKAYRDVGVDALAAAVILQRYFTESINNQIAEEQA